LLTYDYYYLNR